MIQKLDVYLWGIKVGTLIAYKEKYNENACFYFDANFIKTGYDIAPLRASIKSASANYGLPIYADSDKMYCGLPSFIADSLPDHWGNVVFNEWAKLHNFKVRELSSLDRLAYIGSRGMGALEFVPDIANKMEQPFKVEIAELYKLAQIAIDDAKSFKTTLDNSDLKLESLFKVGTSAGGRRPKAIINLNLETKECYSGQVSTPYPGFTPMIIKFDEHIDVPTTNIEYSYYLMAVDAGLNMMPSHIIKSGGETHFITERFDRKNNEKIHIQTLAAMNPLADSYEDLFDVACNIDITPIELSQLFLSMVMNVVAGNVDDHSKNFSFLMGKDGMWHLSPTYDFTFAIDTSAPGYINSHSLTINNKNRNINRRDLLEVAKRYSITEANAIIDNAVTIASNYRDYAMRAGVEELWIEKITSEISDRIARM